MKDPVIRRAFHRSYLENEHSRPDTLVVDELGLVHGKCRADIAVINGHLIGYEIKSDSDTLVRLKNQIATYNAVFDHSSIVLEKRHLNEALQSVPSWWGVILVEKDGDYLIRFDTIREPTQNPQIDDLAVAQLLWRDEALEILIDLGIKGKRLRECRDNLYRYIIDLLDPLTLRRLVREYLKKRQIWRHLGPPFLCDD